MMPGVAVTGMSLLAGTGLDVETAFTGLLSGKSPIRRFSLFDPEGLPCTFGVELPLEAQELIEGVVSPRRRAQMTRGTSLAIASARAAMGHAGLCDSDVDRRRIAVVLGATGTGYAPTQLDHEKNRILKNMASSPAAWVSLTEKIEGPSFVVSTACSSGAYALHAGLGLIASGQVDIALVGAADSALSRLDVGGFCELLALCTDESMMESASRPFDRTRSGFVMGEGAGMLVLESFESAARRRAQVLAHAHVPGLTSEAYNIVSPRPDGASIVRAMSLALQNAGLLPSDIDYVNAHGTSTPQNDLVETKAIQTVFGPQARVPVSSTKSMTGHCLSAAAAVEAVICCEALRRGIIPPTMNLHQRDPELDLDYVPHEPRRASLRHVMSNSFAFGGHNAVCVFSAP
ncbi:MAG: beta-ketoacyl-[acyl-carrier-protein] synthase family protein [Myxococcota bacterium]|jgi:3-oxoacyl-[acyl-carrier-protein] synthase II|nr:beta-ketoacyl-[acyl-carrier-protein] synthase family protein [Myxococcota bacterium]